MELKLLKNYKCCLKKENYSKNDGFLVGVWGPMQWGFLHIFSFNYPSNPNAFNKKYNKENKTKNYKIQEHYSNYIENLTNILPCKSCRDNLKVNLKNMKWFEKKDFYLKNRENFSRFIYDLHNEVNKMLGRPKYKSYEFVRDTYEGFRARCPKKSTKHSGCTKLDINDEFKNEVLKGKCKISIVPHDENDESENLKVDEKCSIIAARDRKSRKPNKNNSIYIKKPIYAKRKTRKSLCKNKKSKSCKKKSSRAKGYRAMNKSK
jgi:hypothetical protein